MASEPKRVKGPKASIGDSHNLQYQRYLKGNKAYPQGMKKRDL